METTDENMEGLALPVEMTDGGNRNEILFLMKLSIFEAGC